jgi:hypothetical protein
MYTPCKPQINAVHLLFKRNFRKTHRCTGVNIHLDMRRFTTATAPNT